jgi:hypothetical protein
VAEAIVGMGAIYLINAYHLWFFLMRLPEEERRFWTIAVGTVYPVIASTVTMSKSSPASEATSLETVEQVRFWLTYWVCYMVLFIAMDYAENGLGKIPGFYTMCAMATLYLFLPMFNGCQAICRKVLVRLLHQQEQLALFDVRQVRRRLEHGLTQSQRERVLAQAAKVFGISGSHETMEEPTPMVSNVKKLK